MLGVLTKYLVKSVLHFSHQDFLTALRVDLGPILGETGLWALRNYQQRQADKGKEEKKVKARVAIDLINKYLETGLEVLGQVKKYESSNRFGPKKMPERQVKRSSIAHLYSWTQYAPLAWFEEQRKLEEDVKNAKDNKGAPAFNLCSYCSTPESQTMKHKRCSQCKQRLYCSTDCQKYDWSKGHKTECKELAKQAK
jgi:hypothetical protein